MSLKARIASLVVELTANAATFNSELRDSRNEARNWGAEVKKVAAIGGAALAASAAVGVAALSSMADEAMDSVDAMAKHADKIGMSTVALAGLRHQAELNGVAQNQLDMGLQRMVRRVAEAASGTGEAVGALAELGISAQELANMKPDEQFYAVADAMQNIEGQSKKVRLAFKLFDSGGVGLVNAMRGGSEVIAASVREAEALGLAVSRIDASKIETANDASDRAAKVFQGLGNTLAVKVAPFITEIKTQFVNSAIAANGFRDVVSKGMAVTATAVGLVADTIHGMKAVWLGVQLAAATFVAATLSNLELLYQGVAKVAGVLPGLNGDIDQNSGIALWARTARIVANGLGDDLHKLAMQEMPSEKVRRWFIDVEKSSTDAAAAFVESQEALNNQMIKPPDPDDDLFTSVEVDRLHERLTAQNETIAEAYRRRELMLINTLKANQISEERYMEVSKLNYASYAKEVAKIEEAKAKTIKQGTGKFFTDMSALSEHGNRNLMLIGKTAATMNVIMSTIESAQNAYKWASAWGGPIAGAGAAASATIAGTIRLRALQSNSIASASSSSASSPTSGASTATTTATPNTAANISALPREAQTQLEQRAAGKAPEVNVIEDAERAGTVEQRTGSNHQEIVDVFVSNYRQGGEMRDILDTEYQRTG